MTTDVSPLRRHPVPYTEASRAVANDPEILAMTEGDLVAGIDRLRHERDAVILAHNYQVPAVQDQVYEVRVPEPAARRATTAVRRMLDLA